MTTQPAPDARTSSLHRRLTVALASAADRARVTEAIAGALSLQGPAALPRLGADDLWQAAGGFARGRADDRKALRARLDAVAARTMHDCETANHQLEHLSGWSTTLVEGAAWAAGLHADLPEHLAVVEAARAALDERRAEQRACQQALERVLEQRNAAAVAIEEADREVGELAGTGMDESGLRRELEAAGQALQEAQQAHSDARARLEELQLEATGLEIRRETLEDAVTASPAPGATDGAVVAAVRDALAALQSVTIDGEIDPEADALAEAWSDLSADLAEFGGAVVGPSEEEIDAVRRRAAAAAAQLAELDAVVSASAITPEQRAALDAAHAEVLAAEDAMGRRRGAAAARKRLEAARAEERALLDQLGFGGYLDVVLSGGRSGAADPNRAVLEREHFEANLALEALERAADNSPEARHLRSERARLLAHIIELLGVDPGTEVLPLLRAHRPLTKSLQQPLVEALAAAGVHPVGIALEDAAVAFLEAQPQPEADLLPAAGDDARHGELAEIQERALALADEMDAAIAEVERSASALQAAERAVDAFEGELSVRAGEDLQRMKRFAAMEQLRAQIDAVAATLRRAEADARAAVESSDRAVAVAESAFEHAAAGLTELAHQARKLAEELPIDQRPTGDPLQSLEELAARLAAHAQVLRPEIDQAQSNVDTAASQLEEAMAACRLVSTDDDQPLREDLVEGLQQLLQEHVGDSLLLLDDPFAGVDPDVRVDLLEVVLAASASRPLALLTEDADTLGWAIELPIEEASALPADALVARLHRTTDSRAVDITTPAPTAEPAPTARRWAGQR